MKLKNLRKKIRRLEARLQEGPKKLAKLKRKLEATATADVEKARRKSAARAGEARQTRQTVKSSTPTQKKRRSVAKKVKRKLNLSPERRAQLAAAMKARWAARRAAAEANPQNTSTDRDFTLGQAAQAP